MRNFWWVLGSEVHLSVEFGCSSRFLLLRRLGGGTNETGLKMAKRTSGFSAEVLTQDTCWFCVNSCVFPLNLPMWPCGFAILIDPIEDRSNLGHPCLTRTECSFDFVVFLGRGNRDPKFFEIFD